MEPFLFRKIFINFQALQQILEHAKFLEDNLATVGEKGLHYVSLGNITNVQIVKMGNPLGTSVLDVLAHKAIPQVAPEQRTEIKPTAIFVSKIYQKMNIDTNAKYNSLSDFEF